MSRSRGIILDKARACFCALLMLTTQVWISGCGQAGFSFPVTPWQHRMELTPEHPISQALLGSDFAGATALEIFPSVNRFRLVFPDRDREANGAFAIVNGQFAITQFSFAKSGAAATITFDEAHRITGITTIDGQSWTRPPEPAQLAIVDAGAENPYIAANQDLLDIAAQLEADGFNNGTIGSPTGNDGPDVSGVTSDTAPARVLEGLSGVRLLLTVFAAIWAPIAGIIQPLLTLFTVATVVDSALLLRFDGTWQATNASNNLIVTVSAGRITMMVDDASQQELEVLDSEVESVSGDAITWVVETSLLGQVTSVQFTFDVAETPDGSLQGTLTVIGDSFSRVPVTMTRL